MSRLPLTLGVAAGVVVLDQVTKALAVAMLEGEPPIEVLGQWLQLTFVRNPGAAFSLAGNYTIVISVIAIVVAVAIVRTARTLTNVWWAVVLGGILGGALGNLIDRVRFGYVIDFVHWYWKGFHWPVFNLADSAISIAAVLLIVFSFTAHDKKAAT